MLLILFKGTLCSNIWKRWCLYSIRYVFECLIFSFQKLLLVSILKQYTRKKNAWRSQTMSIKRRKMYWTTIKRVRCSLYMNVSRPGPVYTNSDTFQWWIQGRGPPPLFFLRPEGPKKIFFLILLPPSPPPPLIWRSGFATTFETASLFHSVSCGRGL